MDELQGLKINNVNKKKNIGLVDKVVKTPLIKHFVFPF
jgi:hypothetical protein